MLSTKQLQSFPLEELDWLIVNQGEMATIYDSLVGKEAQIDPESEDSPEVVIENAQRLFKKLGNRTNILCTIGGQGVIYVRSTSDSKDQQPKSGHLPAAKLLNPIKDTTGAGDCFMGFFAAGMSRIARSDGFKSESDVSDEEFEGVLKTCLTVSGASSCVCRIVLRASILMIGLTWVGMLYVCRNGRCSRQLSTHLFRA